MCNVPTSQVHAWNGGSGGFLSGSTELKDPSSFNLVKACRSSHVGCHVVTRDVWLGLTLPHHVTSFHVDMSKGSSQDFHSHHSPDFTGFHRPSLSPIPIPPLTQVSEESPQPRHGEVHRATVFQWPSSSCCSTPQWALRGHEIPISSTIWNHYLQYG